MDELKNALSIGYGEFPKSCRVESFSASILPFRIMRSGKCKTCGIDVKNIFPYGGDNINDTGWVDNKDLFCPEHRPHNNEYDDCVQWDGGREMIKTWKNINTAKEGEDKVGE